MVQLKPRIRMGEGRIPKFQFQNGTIKAMPVLWSIAFDHRFQFQNGTIKAGMLLRRRSRPLAFQFQNGTIKAFLSFE